MIDPASEVLFLPLQSGQIAWPAPGQTLILGGRAGIALNGVRAQAPVIEQGFKPWADALQRDGFLVSAAVEGSFPLVFVRAPRQRLESRALLARALVMAGAGVVVACAGNDEGGRTLQADLAQLAGPVHHDSKAHCRVAWSTPGAAAFAPHLLGEWLQLDAPRPILDGAFVSRPGLFAWDRIDVGSALLADCLSSKLSGHGADIGAGFGVLSKALLARAPGVTALDLFEAQARALELARVNLADARVPLQFHWHDVTTGLPRRYDFIVSNPPFHAGRADDPGLGRAFIAAAAKALRDGGRLWLVANRHLPYEQALAADFASVRVVRDEGGFKVIEAIRGRTMKLLKLIANLGYGSRKQVALLFREGRITDAAGEVLYADDVIDPLSVRIDEEPLDPPPGLLLMLHKPVAVTCSTKDQGRVVYDLLPPRWRRRDPLLSTVGRLDRDTSGLLLMTDDGALLHRITSPKTGLGKVYVATLAEDLRGNEGELFASGTLLLEGETTALAPAQFSALGPRQARLTLHEGRYHQVRRMFAATGNAVETLHREAIGGLTLQDLPAGEWRILDAADRALIFAGG